MRDLFRNLVHEAELAPRAAARGKASRVINVLSMDPKLIEVLEQGFAANPNVTIGEFELGRADEPFVAALYDPTLHDPGVVKVLMRLQAAKNLAIFAKPVAIPSLIRQLTRRL